ncbi:UNVERIFIED_CONTAM: hypothetical protein Sangu_0209300 [Sesamum angustifolium]
MREQHVSSAAPPLQTWPYYTPPRNQSVPLPIFEVCYKSTAGRFHHRRRYSTNPQRIIIRSVRAMAVGVPICVECGTRSNPCRCKVVGPTIGFLAFAAAAVVEWPVGALVYCFRHMKGRRIMAHPATVVYPAVTNSIPI